MMMMNRTSELLMNYHHAYVSRFLCERMIFNIKTSTMVKVAAVHMDSFQAIASLNTKIFSPIGKPLWHLRVELPEETVSHQGNILQTANSSLPDDIELHFKSLLMTDPDKYNKRKLHSLFPIIVNMHSFFYSKVTSLTI